MPATEAQRRANLKYLREKVKSVNVRFYPDDRELWDFLGEQPNKQGYIRGLIRADMESRRASG